MDSPQSPPAGDYGADDSSLSDWSDNEAEGEQKNVRQVTNTSQKVLFSGRVDEFGSPAKRGAFSNGLVSLSAIRMQRRNRDGQRSNSPRHFAFPFTEHLIMPQYWQDVCKQQLPKQPNNKPIILTEEQVIQETLWALAGLPTVLFYTIEGNNQHLMVAVNPVCSVQNISHTCLAEALRTVCHSIGCLNLIRAFVCLRKLPSRTHEACQGWLQRYLFELDCSISKDCTNKHSIFDLVLFLRGIVDEIECLFHVLEQTLTEDCESGITYQKVSLLLSNVYRALEFCLAGSRMISQEEPELRLSSLLLDLLLALMQPTCQLIDHWMKSGQLEDKYREFFIVPRKSNSEFKVLDDPSPLLVGLAECMILAGKSTQYLQQFGDGTDKNNGNFLPMILVSQDPLHKQWLISLGLKRELKLGSRLSIRTASTESNAGSANSQPRPMSCPGFFEFSEKRLSMLFSRENSTSSSYNLSGEAESQEKLSLFAASDIRDIFQSLVRERCTQLCECLMVKLRGQFGLAGWLRELKAVYSLFALQSFCSAVFDPLLTLGITDGEVIKNADGDDWLKDLTFLNSALHGSLLGAGLKEPEQRWFAALQFKSKEEDGLSSSGSPVLRIPRHDPLQQIVLRPRIIWPLNQVICESHITAYNRMSQFLLILCRARYQLCKLGLREMVSLPTKLRAQCFLTRFRLLQFLVTILSGILDQFEVNFRNIDLILHAKDVQAARLAHDELIRRLSAVCLQDKRLEMVLKPLLRVCTLVERFSVEWAKLVRIVDQSAETGESHDTFDRIKRVADAEARVKEIVSDFERCRTFMLSIFRISKASFPSLESIYALLTFAE